MFNAIKFCRSVGRPAKEIPDHTEQDKTSLVWGDLKDLSSPEKLSSEKLEALRKKRQREANNIASRICRKKRKEKMEALEEECQGLLFKNDFLKTKVKKLERLHLLLDRWRSARMN